MHPVRRVSVIGQVEQAVRELIESGSLRGELPSLRSLSESLNVSVPTASAALHALCRQGLLLRGGRNRPFRLAETTAPRRPAAAGRRLLVIGNEPWDGLTPVDRDLIAQVTQALRKEGCAVSTACVPFALAKSGQRRWDAVLRNHKPTHLAILRGNQPMVDWATRSRLPFVLVGSRGRVRCRSIIGSRLLDALADSVERLKALGHRRILVPVLSYDQGTVAPIRELLAERLGIEATGKDASQLAPFVGSDTPRDWRSALLAALRGGEATAIVLLEWREYMLASTLVAQAGLRVPDDLSLVCVDHDTEMRWVTPAPAHYHTDTRHYARMLRQWLRSSTVDHERMNRQFLTSWTPGESIGPAPSAPPARILATRAG